MIDTPKTNVLEAGATRDWTNRRASRPQAIEIITRYERTTPPNKMTVCALFAATVCAGEVGVAFVSQNLIVDFACC